MRISHTHHKPNFWNGPHITYNIREEISDTELVIDLTSYPLCVDSFQSLHQSAKRHEIIALIQLCKTYTSES